MQNVIHIILQTILFCHKCKKCTQAHMMLSYFIQTKILGRIILSIENAFYSLLGYFQKIFPNSSRISDHIYPHPSSSHIHRICPNFLIPNFEFSNFFIPIDYRLFCTIILGSGICSGL